METVGQNSVEINRREIAASWEKSAMSESRSVATIKAFKNSELGEAWVELMGLSQNGKRGNGLAAEMENELNELLETAGAKVLRDDDKLEDAIRRVVRQVAVEEIGKKPEVTVVVSRLMEG